MNDVTQILDAAIVESGQTTEQLLPFVYRELRELAARRLAQERPGQTLQATALVHEVFLRLFRRVDGAPWENSRHFYAVAAQAMRRVLIDIAREKQSLRSGGRWNRVDLESMDLVQDERSKQLLKVDEALEHLASVDPAKAELVTMRFFAGFTMEEAAQALGISVSSAKRSWTFAKAWLRRQLDEP